MGTIKKYLLCILFLIGINEAFGQWQWVNTIPDSGNSMVTAITIDEWDNVYVTGYYVGEMVIGSDTIAGYESYYEDIFIAKYNSSGTMQWHVSAGGINEDKAWGIALDRDGNIYVSGSFYGLAKFGEDSLVGNGGKDIFVAKYNNNGGFVWAKSWGGEFDDICMALNTSDNTFFYIAGAVMQGSSYPPVANSYATVGFDSITLTSYGDGDIFLAKLDTAGNIIWANNSGGKFGDDVALGLIVGPQGESYLTGSVSYTTSYFGGDSLIDKSTFVAKYDSLGNTLWVRGINKQTFGIYGTGIATDSKGNIFALGYSLEEVPKIFSPGIVVNEFAYLVKYDSLGNLLWAKGIGAPYYTGVRGLVVDGDDNIYFSGYFNYKLYVGGDTVYAYGHDDIFLNKYENDGTQRWTMNVGGQGFDQGSALCMDNQGDLLLGGYIGSAPAYFGTQEASSLSQRDAFVAKYTPGYASIPDVSPIEPRIILYPNPSSGAVHIRCKGNVFDNLEIRDMQGRAVYRTAIGSDDFFLDLGQLPAGMYALVVSSEAVQSTRLLIMNK